GRVHWRRCDQHCGGCGGCGGSVRGRKESHCNTAMGVVMTRRVWLLDRPTLAYPPDDPRSVRKRARVLASDTVGWPRADGDRWPCHGNGWCDALAIWRTSD